MHSVGTSSSGLSEHNIAIGTDALKGEITGTQSVNYNIAIGNCALQKGNDTNSNIAIGHWSLQNFNSNSFYNNGKYHGYNIMIGNGAGQNLLSGNSNIGLGVTSLWNLQTGSNNIAIGNNACNNVTGSNKICIGNNSGPLSTQDDATNDFKRVYLGDDSTTVYIPGNLVVGKSVYVAHDHIKESAYDYDNIFGLYLPARYDGYKLVKQPYDWRNNEWGYPVIPSDFPKYTQVVDSDRRLKYVGKENKSGLDKIRQLKVFNYTFKKDPKKEPHVGVIAQDLQKIFPDAVKKGVDGFLTIRMEDMFYAVINAIKELDAKVTAQEKKIKELEARIEKLEAKIK